MLEFILYVMYMEFVFLIIVKHMGATIEGKESKNSLKLKGKTVIVENIGCYSYDKNTDSDFVYRKEVIYHFNTEEAAKEYYYKKK